MEPSRKNLVLSNLTERMFVWTPPKTASTSASKILPKLGFQLFNSEEKYLRPNSSHPHNHSCIFFHGHEKYSFISTLRNPYTFIVPLFTTPREKENWSQEYYEMFLDSFFYSKENQFADYTCYNYSVRKPDYVIRVESMLSDYLKIPFVKNTHYFKSGELEKDCLIKENSSDSTNFDWKSLYNQNIADKVYYNFAQVFELGEYDRNSWKK